MADKVIVEYEARLKKLEKEYARGEKSVKGFDKAVDKSQKTVQTASSSIISNVKNLAGVLGVAFGAQQLIKGINAIIDTNKAFEKSLSTLSSITGATGKDLAFFEEQAKRIGAATTLSAGQVADAFTLIGSAQPELLKAPKQLVAVAEAAAVLAEAAGLDLPAAADALTTSLNQFGLTGDDAERVINVLAASAKEGAVAIPTLSETLRVVGTVASAAGLSIEETAAAAEVLGQKGIKGAEAGTSLRNIFLRLQKEGIGVTDGIFNLNDALVELEEKNLSVTEASKLFGDEAITAGNILIDNREQFVNLTSAITGTGVAFDQAAVNTDNLEGSIARFDSVVESLVLNAGVGLANAFRGVIDLGAGLLGVFVKLTTAERDFSDGLNAEVELLQKEQTEFNLLIEGIKRGNITQERRAKLIEDVNVKFGDLLENEITEQTNLRELTRLQKEGNDALIQKIILKSREAEITELINKISDAEIRRQKEIQKLDDSRLEQLKNLSSGQLRTAKQSERNSKASLSRIEEELKGFDDQLDAEDELTQKIKDRLFAKEKIIEIIDDDTDATDDNTKTKKEAASEQLKLDEEFAKADKARRDAEDKAEEDRIDRNIKAGTELATFRLEQGIRDTEDIQTRAALQVQLAQKLAQEEIASINATADEKFVIEQKLIDKIAQINTQASDDQKAKDKKDKDERIALQLEIADSIVSNFNTISSAFLQISGNATEKRLNELNAQRESELENFEGTEEQKMEIEARFKEQENEILRKEAVREKAVALSQAAINGALAVTKAIALLGPPPSPAGIAGIIAAGVTTAAQIAIIASQPIPQFAKGVIGVDGPGSGTSDSIIARLSKGESVITASKTKAHREELEAIHKGTFDKLINYKYIIPALDKAEQSSRGKRDKNLAREMALSLNNSDYNLLRALGKDTKLHPDTIDQLTKQSGYDPNGRRHW